MRAATEERQERSGKREETETWQDKTPPTYTRAQQGKVPAKAKQVASSGQSSDGQKYSPYRCQGEGKGEAQGLQKGQGLGS